MQFAQMYNHMQFAQMYNHMQFAQMYNHMQFAQMYNHMQFAQMYNHIIPNIGTDRSEQIVQIQIRLRGYRTFFMVN